MAPLKNVLRGLRDHSVVSKAELETLPSMDQPTFYDPISPQSSTASLEADAVPRTSTLTTNSGNKRKPAARWIRRGKICTWGPNFEEMQQAQQNVKRLKLCMEQFLPEAAAEVNAAPPEEIVRSIERKQSRKRKREEAADFILPHLRSPSPPASTIDLAPMLALPQSYLDIMTSPALRHTLGTDTTETGLQKTAAEMLEGERGLMQSLGRLMEVLRVRSRDVMDQNLVPDSAAPTAATTNGDHAHVNSEGSGQDAAAKAAASAVHIQPLPHISDTDNLWRVTQELLQSNPPPTITFTVTPEGAAAPVAASPAAPPMNRTPVHRLFTHPNGLVINSIPQANAAFYNVPPGHPNYPQSVKYNLDLPNQCRAVDDALERINELLADCNEFKERLEEAGMRVADVARVRKRVWGVIKERTERELDRAEGKA